MPRRGFELPDPMRIAIGFPGTQIFSFTCIGYSDRSGAFPGFAGPRYRVSTTPPWHVNGALNLELKKLF
ncbi:MAG: hypothetical protein ACTSXN_00315 [Promethearchaeota archaeon]